jgi:alkyl hydroperoxide reductase subunit AhpF
MALLSDVDRRRVQDRLAALVRPVRLVFFTQTFGCDTCHEAAQILRALVELSPQLSLVEHNLILDEVQARAYGVDRAPSVAVVAVDPDGREQDYGVRFVGVPSGYEFMSLLEAVTVVSSGEAGLAPESRDRLARLTEPVHLQVFVTPT